MSLESIVRQTLNLCDHKIDRIEQDEKGIMIYLEKKLFHKLPCSNCGKRARSRDKLDERCWRHVYLWGIPVFLIYTPSRINCKRCGIKVEKIPWSMGKSDISLPLIILLATWARLLAWDQISKLFKVSWSTVSKSVNYSVQYGIAHRDLSTVIILGIDEISRKKGHVYHTQVYDLEEKKLLWSGEGRKEEVLRKFFDEMGEEFCKRLTGICCDMWEPYITVIKERAPQATLVFDKFHIINHLLDAVDKTRKAELKDWEDKEENPLKMTKYIWLKNPKNLTHKQKDTLEHLMRMNLKITKAYLLKEAFRELWKCRTPEKALTYIRKWFWWATHSRIKDMRDFAWMLRRHEENILSWFTQPIDNGATEAMNNNAKEVSHRARGYRTGKTFTLSLLHCLGGLQMPKLAHKFT